MTPDEQQLRDDLVVLAGSQQGRRLLQLGLRGVARGERGVTAGCWTQRGDAGCLFQHAYWEGVREGVFADKGRPGDWIGSFVGAHDYGIVIRVIESFDRLARSQFADVTPRTLLPNRVRIRQADWNTAVEHVLVDVLGKVDAEPIVMSSELPASV
jgi:hypothetical protein